AEIGRRAGGEIGDGDALVVGMPLLDGARAPHRGLAALDAEETGIERAVAVEGLWRRDAHAPAAACDRAHEGAVRSNLGRVPERAELGLDLPWWPDVGGLRDRVERSLRVVARQKPPVEHEANLVLHGVGRLRPGADRGRRERGRAESWMLAAADVD